MIVGAKLLLLQVAIMLLLPLSDPRVDGKRKQNVDCNRKIQGCGEFHPPENSGGRVYTCTFNKNTCAFACKFKCQKGPDRRLMKISNRFHAREFYKCDKGKWYRRDTPKGYCQARVIVKEVKQNLHHINVLNKLANRLINSSFVYLAMASFYERADVALPGFSKLMTDLWQSNMKHARELMTYVNTRGGYINLSPVPRPSSHEDLLMTLGKRTGLVGVQSALGETRNVNDLALQVHVLTTAKPKADPHMKHVLEDGLLSYKVETIKKLADLEKQLQSFLTDEDYTIGEYSMDLTLRE